jgi:hypothetical protein
MTGESVMIGGLPEREDPAALIGFEADVVELTAQERGRPHRRVTTRAGRVFTLVLPPGDTLVPGRVLYVGPGFYVTVAAGARGSAWRSRSAACTPRLPSWTASCSCRTSRRCSVCSRAWGCRGRERAPPSFRSRAALLTEALPNFARDSAVRPQVSSACRIRNDIRH